MAQDNAQQAQHQYFRVTDSIPPEAWYWAGIGSVFAALSLWLAGERGWSEFVGQWPPMFLLLALFHKKVQHAS